MGGGDMSSLAFFGGGDFLCLRVRASLRDWTPRGRDPRAKSTTLMAMRHTAAEGDRRVSSGVSLQSEGPDTPRQGAHGKQYNTHGDEAHCSRGRQESE